MYWPTMDDDILDIVVDASAGTRDTWWSKLTKIINNLYLNLMQNALMDMITLYKMYVK